jgi:enoyl-[acyl-carrier protein] reductase II
MMIRTRITTLLKCKYPIILPGMSWISNSDLVAAVSNAGGVGILATGPLSADETRAEIRRIRTLLIDPNLPFGVGATLLMPGAADNARVAMQEQVPLVNISLGKADWIADGVHSYGGTLLSTVTNAQHAMSAIAAGADAIMVTGHEAAAHGGDVTSLVLIPALAAKFPDTPIVAAGGFATGRGLLAALTLGADAVAMGSRLAVTQNSPLAQDTKEFIQRPESDESATVYGHNFDGIPARVLKTPTARRLMQSRPWFPVVLYRALQAARALKMPLWKVLPGLLTQWDKMFVIAQFGAATQSLTQATIHGDVQHGVQFIGQSQGLIADIPSVDEVMQRIMREAHDISLVQARLFQENNASSSSCQ